MFSKKTMQICINILCWLVVFYVPTNNAKAETNSFLLEIAKTGDAMLKSGKCDVDFKKTVSEDVIQAEKEYDREHQQKTKEEGHYIFYKENETTMKIKMLFDSVKLYVEKEWDSVYENDMKISYLTKKADNGEKMDSYTFEENHFTHETWTRASIKPARKVSPKYQPRYYGYFIYSTPVADFLSGTFKTSIFDSLDTIGQESIDGIDCLIYKGHIANSDSTVTAWIAPELLCRPKKIVLETSIQKQVTTITHKLHNDYIWFPDVVEHQYYRAENKNSQKKLASFWKMIFEDVTLNCDIPPETFSIQYPIGTKVYDFRTELLLTVGTDMQNTPKN